MASSQVEIASSPPFGCALRDHNRRDRCRSENNARATQTAFHNNFKNLVRNHFRTCISVSSGPSSSAENQSSNNADSWVGKNGEREENNDGNDCPAIMSSRQAWIVERQGGKEAKEMVPTPIETPSASSSPGPSTSRREDNTNVLTRSDSLGQISSLGGASSLVQIWEKRLNKSYSMNSRTTMSCKENASSCSAASSVDESADVGPASEDSFSAMNLDRNNALTEQQPPSSPLPPQDQNLDAGESERVRVADIIRRLTAANQMQSSLSSSLSDENEHISSPNAENISSTNASPSRERERSSSLDHVENRSFSQVVCSPRIRGRQAFTDLLMQIERDRHGELDKLVSRRAVSRFSQRGRIQVK